MNWSWYMACLYSYDVIYPVRYIDFDRFQIWFLVQKYHNAPDICNLTLLRTGHMALKLNEWIDLVIWLVYLKIESNIRCVMYYSSYRCVMYYSPYRCVMYYDPYRCVMYYDPYRCVMMIFLIFMNLKFVQYQYNAPELYN